MRRELEPRREADSESLSWQDVEALDWSFGWIADVKYWLLKNQEYSFALWGLLLHYEDLLMYLNFRGPWQQAAEKSKVQLANKLVSLSLNLEDFPPENPMRDEFISRQREMWWTTQWVTKVQETEEDQEIVAATGTYSKLMEENSEELLEAKYALFILLKVKGKDPYTYML